MFPSSGRTGDVYGSVINVNRNILDDVIPELDENMTTIVSTREEKKKPTVQDIFGGGPITNNEKSDDSFQPKQIVRSFSDDSDTLVLQDQPRGSAQLSSSCPAVLPDRSLPVKISFPTSSSLSLLFDLSPSDTEASDGQIGRASCRERV